MYLKKISLTSFRSYKKRVFPLVENGCLVVGGNTAGKTNFLEAVFFLSIGKSFRAGKDREVILWGEKLARVEGEVVLDGEVEKLTALVVGEGVSGRKTSGKKFLVNGVGKRQVDFVGRLAAVLFWPEDLEMITSGPGLRRRYLNRVLNLVDREYRASLVAYERGVRQRNRLLHRIREGEGRREQLYFWDRLLIKNGQLITKKREEFVDFLNGNIDIFYDLEIVYDKSVISEQRLKKYEREEVLAGVTLVGPSRDDIIVNAKSDDGRLIDLQRFGSRGEQRLAVLALKLCEVEYLAEKFGERPVLLLDDIFSELDREHRELVLAKVFDQQTVMTVTDKSILPKKYLAEMEIIEL